MGGPCKRPKSRNCELWLQGPWFYRSSSPKILFNKFWVVVIVDSGNTGVGGVAQCWNSKTLHQHRLEPEDYEPTFCKPFCLSFNEVAVIVVAVAVVAAVVVIVVVVVVVVIVVVYY